jgi:hypothetical protein
MDTFNKETSLIDLAELDEAQLKQLQQELQQEEEDCSNIEEVSYKREIRAMTHRLFLCEEEKRSLQTSVQQSHELCTKYLNDTEQTKSACADLQEKFDRLKQSSRILEQKLNEAEQDVVRHLQSQIAEQQKLDSLERVQEQHENFVQQTRDQHEKELLLIKEKCGCLQSDLNYIHMLKLQLDTARKQAEVASIERADTINILTKSLNDLQTKYDQEVIVLGLSNAKTQSNIDHLNSLVDELKRENYDLTNDLNEKNSKFDLMHDQEEQFQQIKYNLDLEIVSKRQHINECEKLIENLHANFNQQQTQIQFDHQQQQQQNQMILNESEAQILELKLKVTNKEHYIQKAREMYIEVYNDKNNLQDTLKVQYDREYDLKLKQQIESGLSLKLEEQKRYLTESWSQERTSLLDGNRKALEANLLEINNLREKINTAEKKCDDLNAKNQAIESALRLNDEKSQNEKESSEQQVKGIELKLERSERELIGLKREFESGKKRFSELFEANKAENEDLTNDSARSKQPAQLAQVKCKEFEAKLVKVELELKKHEEVSNLYTAYQEFTKREIVAMTSRLSLCEEEKKILKTSVQQSHELCTKYLNDTEQG